MIRVIRVNEPIALENARNDHLPKMIERVVNNNETPKSEEFKGYGVVKGELVQSSGNKCWYCEKMGDKGDEVDHFRPKTKAQRGHPHPTTGYWWLAWTWKNLIFACNTCNKVKGSKFPLKSSSSVLEYPDEPPGNEAALLLDPAVDDPLDHIEFIRDDGNDERWRPVGITEPGKVTIEILQLDGKKRQSILDHYRYHVKNTVLPRVQKYQELWNSGNHDAARRVWQNICLALLQYDSPHAALSYAALNVLVSPEQRAVFPVPRPPYSPGDHVAT